MQTNLKHSHYYSIELIQKDGKRVRQRVMAYRVILPEVPDVEFFIYRKYGKKSWRVCDAILGQEWIRGCINEQRTSVIESASEKS